MISACLRTAKFAVRIENIFLRFKLHPNWCTHPFVCHQVITMWKLASSVISLLKNPSTPLVTCVRFYERRRFIRRFGYRPHYHAKGKIESLICSFVVNYYQCFVSCWLGLLPRIPGEELPLSTVPNEKKPDPWRPQAALFGQNDYIDILGDEKINPTQLMSSIPQWLRKFRGNEMQMLIRKRQAKAHWKWSRPLKWDEMNKTIDFLYKKLNYKKEPKKPEYPSSYWTRPIVPI